MIGRLESFARLGVGLVFVGTIVLVLMVLLLFLLPSRILRIKLTNRVATLLGAGVMRITGSRVTVEGKEHVRADRPAIYAGNHTSILDAFTTIWLTPSGTVGVAKREILYYPFYGAAWWLAGHLLLDRARTDKAKQRLVAAGELVRRAGLHICLMPEGRRSRDGRLLPFKKGVAHLALQTRLPIVPMITIGAQNAWDHGTVQLRRSDITIRFLPPIDTSTWTEEHLDRHLDALRQVFIEALPEAQRPLVIENRAAA